MIVPLARRGGAEGVNTRVDLARRGGRPPRSGARGAHARRRHRSSIRPRPGSTPASSSRPTRSSTRSPSCAGTTVGAGAEVGPHVVAVDAEIGPGALVGPFCYLRPGTVLAEGSKAGTFVEMKNAPIGDDAKVPHLSYIGDAEIGEEPTSARAPSPRTTAPSVRREAAHRDRPRRPHREPECVCPSGDDRGSCVDGRWLDDHGGRPAGALAIARARQVNKEGYVGARAR